MARIFDGTQYLRYSGAILSAAPLSLGCWFWADQDDDYDDLICIDDGVIDNRFLLGLGGDGSLYGLTEAGGSNRAAESAIGYSTSVWQHGLAVFAAADSRAIYLDGGNKGTQTTSRVPANLDTTTLAGETGGAYLTGRMAEVAIWNAALTDDEAVILAAGFSPLFVRPQNLVAYWPLIRSEDQDRVGGYDMTAFNAPSVAAQVPIRYPSRPMVGTLAGAAPAAFIQILTTYGGYSVPMPA